MNNFFDDSKPCPDHIHNCEQLRKQYFSLKNSLSSSNCTTCNITDLNYFFYKNFIQIKQTKKIKLNKMHFKKHSEQEKFIPKFFIFKNKVLKEKIFFGKKTLVLMLPGTSNTLIFKVLLCFNLLNLNFYLCKQQKTADFKVLVLLLNKKTSNILFYDYK